MSVLVFTVLMIVVVMMTVMMMMIVMLMVAVLMGRTASITELHGLPGGMHVLARTAS